jgi:hypothetical protein
LRVLTSFLGVFDEITSFRGKSPGVLFIRWLPDGNTIVFELHDDYTHDIEAWSVLSDGSHLTKVADGQIFDLSVLR